MERLLHADVASGRHRGGQSTDRRSLRAVVGCRGPQPCRLGGGRSDGGPARIAVVPGEGRPRREDRFGGNPDERFIGRRAGGGPPVGVDDNAGLAWERRKMLNDSFVQDLFSGQVSCSLNST